MAYISKLQIRVSDVQYEYLTKKAHLESQKAGKRISLNQIVKQIISERMEIENEKSCCSS